MALEKHFQLKISQDPETQHSEGSQRYDDETPELDLIERLRSNIDKLNDLQKKLAFMNTEIESVIGMDSDK